LKDKVLAIDEYLKVNNLTWSDSWYIGNDLNDLGAIQKAQLSLCPKDGVEVIRNQVDVVLKTKGGYGILSEIATILEKKYT
jgi:3-deoxy-D-manno-octulosonate 8-phosphate phosphatase KdsC-like HAD superfamily phosphatase